MAFYQDFVGKASSETWLPVFVYNLVPIRLLLMELLPFNWFQINFKMAAAAALEYWFLHYVNFDDKYCLVGPHFQIRWKCMQQ